MRRYTVLGLCILSQRKLQRYVIDVNYSLKSVWDLGTVLKNVKFFFAKFCMGQNLFLSPAALTSKEAQKA